MNREREFVEDIFEAALSLPPVEQRAYLDDACRGDLQLRQRVEELLADHRLVGSFLQHSPLAFLDGVYAATDPSGGVIAGQESDSHLTGRTLAHFQITEALGAGGMGEVFRATDTRLGREVALKVLPPALATDAERLAGFRREARAVAALNHPQIVTLYSVEEAEGIHFLIMELVEGQPLHRLIPEGGLPVAQVVSIATALTEALMAAHGKGIVHRDLKPANVMVTSEGRVKVLDFGLAKETSEHLSTVKASALGLVMGTPAYMSPEQVRGQDVDHRTDIFSLGVVLYEMATGCKPFQGRSRGEYMLSILRDTPPAPLGIPAELAQIIQRCLEKERDRRFQTARELCLALREVERAAPQVWWEPELVEQLVDGIKKAGEKELLEARSEQGFWVAVLPFKCTSVNPSIIPLAAGLTEAVVTGLSRFSYLRVISLSSTSRYAHHPIDLRIAGAELGARYVVEGTISEAGPGLRVAVQVRDSRSGADLWAESYDRPFSQAAALPLLDDVVPRIVSTLADMQGVLAHSMSEAMRNRDPESLNPYQAVLRSFAYFQRVDAEEHAASRAALEFAVEQAPAYADAWAMLSMLYKEEYTHEFNRRPDPLGRAFAAAQRAIEAAPSSHLAQHAGAAALFFRRETGAFRVAAERAVALNPTDGFTMAYLGLLLAYGGDWERGRTLTERARTLNPHHPGWYWFAPFFDAYRKNDYRAALEIAPKLNTPGFWPADLALAAVYGQVRNEGAAEKPLRDLLGIRPDFAKKAREELAKWWDPKIVEQLVDGLRKAGLEVIDNN